MTSVQHAILTRFNLPTPGYEGYLRATPQWLEDRFNLFERYCLPSIAAQTCKDFVWVIYFDPQTPDWAMDKIAAHQKQGLYHPIFREEVPKPSLLADLRGLFAQADGLLLTSSVDNDDMIARDYVERLQAAARQGGMRRLVFNFTRGFTYRSGQLYSHSDHSNAFTSMGEPWTDALTIWHDWHTRLHQHAPVLQIGPEPGWVQIIHGRNVSNRIRGWLVAPAAAKDFTFPAGELAPQTAGALVADRLRYLCVRQPRELARRTARAIISAILPREALNEVKLKLSRLRNSVLSKSSNAQN